MNFGTALQLLLIGLKLTGSIAWAWWWILLPLEILLVVAVAVGVYIARSKPPAGSLSWWVELQKKMKAKDKYERVHEAMKKED